ncbi:sulfotransferase 6B1-like [Branchiostoma lanceolatum]|uniref:sulfotransferase 6B1-like n=1 Tax=Branchiostoma lanceolatum TaxID=7740 RepID=UPI00345120E9
MTCHSGSVTPNKGQIHRSRCKLNFGTYENHAFSSMASSQQQPLPGPPPYAEYQGILFPVMVPRESLEAMKTFEIRDDDVVIVSYPKSGTNWMYEVVYKILGGKNENTSPKAPEFLPPEKQQPYYIELRESPSPRLMHTHLHFRLAPPGLAAPSTKV